MGYRLIGCLFVVICPFLIGLEMRSRLRVRIRSLEMLRDYFRSVRRYISYVGMSLDDIAYEIDRGADKSKISLIIREKTRQTDFATSFSDAMDALHSALCITADDQELLGSIARGIGGLDREGALDYLQLADEQISSVVECARARCETDGKIYVALGISGGIVAALMLL